MDNTEILKKFWKQSIPREQPNQQLRIISEMSKLVSFRSGKMDKDEQFDFILPTFVLCLRDFTLDLAKNGKEITAEEYLADCLELKAGTEKEIEQYNRPRESIRKYFPRRKCFTFDQPGSKSVMKRLETAKANELSEDFRNDTNMFLNYIYSFEPKVLLSSKSLRGKMFATLATTYIDAISSGAIPDVDDAIKIVAKMENQRMARAAVEDFKDRLQTIPLPVFCIESFYKLYEDNQNESLAKFRLEAMFESGDFEREAIVEMNKEWKLIKEQNCELTKSNCIAQLKEIYGEIVREKKENRKYFVSGGYVEYRQDIAKVKRQYRNKMTAELEESQVRQSLYEFTESEADYDSEVLLKDNAISEEDKKRQIEKLEKDYHEAFTKQQNLFEKKIEDQKQRSEEHNTRLESEREAYMRHTEEQMQLLMEGWREQKELSKTQIEMMKAENEKLKQEQRNERMKLYAANTGREK